MLAAALLLAAFASAGPAWLEKPKTAFAEAKKTGRPLLIDFHAPWCYSCYYMEEKVLGREPFRAASRGLVLLRADVDTPEGRALKESRRVSFLPTYVLEDASGRELGRIVGEQTEGEFLERLAALRGGKGGAIGEREALLKRLAAADRAEALRALRRLVELGGACEFPGDLASAEELVDRLPAKTRKELLESERRALEALLARRYFVPAPERCADFRTGVSALVGVYESLGLPKERGRLLERAVSQLGGDGRKAGEDRNRDDDLRHFLELLGDERALKDHYTALLEAYPADYVYPYRYARRLAGQARFIEALPWIEKAWRLSYGANRLGVARVRAQVLAGLGRKEQARRILAREIKAGGKAFPRETAPLRELLAELSR